MIAKYVVFHAILAASQQQKPSLKKPTLFSQYNLVLYFFLPQNEEPPSPIFWLSSLDKYQELTANIELLQSYIQMQIYLTFIFSQSCQLIYSST